MSLILHTRHFRIACKENLLKLFRRRLFESYSLDRSPKYREIQNYKASHNEVHNTHQPSSVT
jgi:hypothetical protein